MRKSVVRSLVAALATAGAAGCGGHTASTAGPAQPGAQTAAPRTAAGAHGTTPSASAATPTPARTRGAVPLSTASGSATATAGSSASPARSATSTSDSSSVLASPGHYTYQVSGTAQTAFGNQNLDGTSDLTVDRPQSGRQHSVDRGNDGTTEQTVVSRSSGVYLADLHISQQGFDEDFRPASAVLLLPANPRQGQSWSWRMTSTDGKYTMRSTLTVADTNDSATVGGRRLNTVAVKTHSVITGSQMQMTIDQRDEAARGTPIVSEHAVVDGKAFGTTFHSDSTRRLQSTTPH